MRRITVDKIDKKSKHVTLDMDGLIATVSIDLIPPDAMEGDILKFVVDKEETENTKTRISSLEKRLFKKHMK
jgi:hydrogenase maturation factor